MPGTFGSRNECIDCEGFDGAFAKLEVALLHAQGESHGIATTAAHPCVLYAGQRQAV